MEQGLRTLEQVGWLGPAPAPLLYADPIALPEDRLPGEPPEGIPVMEHPEAMLLECPELWSAVEQYRSGHRREPAQDEWDRQSYWDVSIWHVMRETDERKREHGRRTSGKSHSPA